MHPEIARLRAELMRARYRPSAWVHFLTSSCGVAQATARSHPMMTRSWRYRAIVRALALPCLASVLGCRRAAPALWLTYLEQQADLYAHLGLNRSAHEPLPHDSFPLATECTLVRAYAAAALLAGCSRPRSALTIGLLSDVLDGYLARHRGEETQLGRLLDGEYDAYLFVAAARAARRQGGLDRWDECVVWLRFGGMLLVGLMVWFAEPQPISLRPTWEGKIGGAMQAAMLWRALSPQRRADSYSTLLMSLGAVLAVAAQLRRLVHTAPTR